MTKAEPPTKTRDYYWILGVIHFVRNFEEFFT
jgi:hypothetical protein